MQELLIIALQDRALGAFTRIGSVATEGHAIRTFQDAINDPQNGEMYKHPDDFDMYVLGTVNTDSGALTPYNTPKKIADGKQLKTT